LVLKEGAPEYLTQDTRNNIYKFNICGAASSPGSDCQRSNGMVCQYRSSMNGLTLEGVIGRFDGKPQPQWGFIDPNNKEAGIKLVLVNGDDCLIHGRKQPRQAVFFFTCDESVGNMGMVAAQEVETCSYVFSVPTRLACPGAVGLSWGWIFIIMTMFISTLYIVLGCMYNRVRNKMTGMEAFPNIEAWKQLPGLVKDGIQWSMQKAGFGQKDTVEDI
jgi:Mannose-6-phosphate receptor